MVGKEVMAALLSIEKIIVLVKLISKSNYIIGLPDGGNGGHGGDVYFRATGRINSLYDLRRAHFKGNDGKSGKVLFLFAVLTDM